jgi:hypothetical protein
MFQMTHTVYKNSYTRSTCIKLHVQYTQSPNAVYSVKVSDIYRVSQEECAGLQEVVPCVKVHRYNPKHLYPKLNGYGDKCGLLAGPRTVPVT